MHTCMHTDTTMRNAQNGEIKFQVAGARGAFSSIARMLDSHLEDLGLIPGQGRMKIYFS